MRKRIWTMLLGVTASMATCMAQQFDEVTYDREKTVFRLNAPAKARKVVVRIYEEALGGTPRHTVTLKKERGKGMAAKEGAALWTGCQEGNLEGMFYTFDTGLGECPGTFAKAVGVNGRRGAILDLKVTDPEGWDKDVRPAIGSPSDLVVYEMHHRDFSIHPSSLSRYPGKFLALTEDHNIEYLKTLGVNAVQILPSYDYATVDESRPDRPQYNWGYDPLNYNVPEGSYSTDATRPEVRIREFKQMVQALHKAGIRVILDVVYNHCMNIAGSNFQMTLPDYYFRKTEKGKGASGDIGTTGGDWANASGCGNETASERALMRQFMLESVKYWIEEYHIDGFRFDLMGIHDIETMNSIRREVDSIDPTITLYGEGWAAGAPALPDSLCAMKARTHLMPGIGAFADEMRDALRGPFSDDHQSAFLNGLPGHEESIKLGLVGGIKHPSVDMSKVNYSKEAWAAQPTQHVSYVSCHDDMSLVDRLRTSIPGISTEELIRLDLLAQTAVLTSQGIPFLWAGEEVLRDKKGVHNSYNSPDSINQINWEHLRLYPQVFQYYSDMIHLRQAHPAFRMGQADKVQRHLKFLDAPSCVIAYQLDGQAVGDSWKTIICILNANRTPQQVSIPQGKYTIVVRDGVVNAEGLGQHTGRVVTVPAQSAIIVHSS